MGVLLQLFYSSLTMATPHESSGELETNDTKEEDHSRWLPH